MAWIEMPSFPGEGLAIKSVDVSVAFWARMSIVASSVWGNGDDILTVCSWALVPIEIRARVHVSIDSMTSPIVW